MTCVDGERDPDVNDDGIVSAADYTPITNNYNSFVADVGIQEKWDLRCDDKLNVVDISRVGFKWLRGF